MSTGQKILVADDSLTIRKLVENVLCQDGYEVITAETGADCLALAAAKKPNLILLDYILPDKQGTEICRELINSPETWEIPVLMMSSNGNAIRQLYQDLNNVADYLTKPFAPSVLTAVVGHLLQRETRSEAGESAATATNPAPAPGADAKPAVPAEFMDKVSRLLELIENRPPAEESAAATPPTAATPAAPARPKARRARKASVSVSPPDTLLRKVRVTAQKHLRARMRQFPDWESREAEQFFLDRLLTRELMIDLAADLVRATGMPAEAPGALRSPASLVPLDTVLRHLHAQRATGELRIETGQETVVVLLQQGEIVFLTTNNPRSYCAGAACDFQSVPHAIIGEAVRAQEEQNLPFFVSLQNAGHLPAGTGLEELLLGQGRKCLVRAFKFAEATITFFPLSRLPAIVRSFKLDVPFAQLLLVCYRSVDDWFTLERVFTEMDATFVPVRELEDLRRSLQLEPEEERVFTAIATGRTVPELAAATALMPFEVCRVLFRFIKLGLVRNGPRRDHDERVDEELTPATVRSEPPVTGESTGITAANPEPPEVKPASDETHQMDAAPAIAPLAQNAPQSSSPVEPVSPPAPEAAPTRNEGAEAAPVPPVPAGVVEAPAMELEPDSTLACSDAGSSSPQSPTAVSSQPEPAISLT
jgi:CheY-like chemotaxis protein